MLAIVAPGQGSQKPGMLTPWLELPGTSERLDHWSAATGLDLARLGTTAGADEITDTAVTQPLVVAAALLAHDALRATIGLPDDFVTAGHSVGELAAYAVAGVLDPTDAVVLAAVRGRAMADACALEPTGMTALLGGVEDEVLARIDACGLTAANRNAPGQIVAAGSLAGLAALVDEPPARARVRALPVAGAFHTEYMAPAAAAFAAAAARLSPGEPTVTLLSNADGRPVTTGADAMAKLVAQMTRPVRWDRCSDTMAELDVRTLLELPPAGTLTGIARRALKGTTQIALAVPADLESIGAPTPA